MNYCKEFSEGVASIQAVPVSEFTLAPSAMLSPVIAPSSYAISENDHSIYLRRSPGAQGTTVVPFLRDSANVKDNVSDSVAGRVHNVTVSCKVDDRSSSVLTTLRTLERYAHCLLIHFTNGTAALVMADKDSYLCTAEDDDDGTSLEIKIQNLAGVQRVES